MADSFKDKVAIVTGGASGIGQALCETLCERGARVVIADIDLAQAQQVAAAISAKGGHARAAQVNVINREFVQKLVADTVSDFGRLDYMFNNAATPATRGALRDIPLEVWDRSIDVNLRGVINGTLAANALMVRQGFGHIVNTGSLAGLVGYPTNTPYAATKAAVVNLSMSLRAESVESGVKVSVVCPGPVHGYAPEMRNKLIGTTRAAQLILDGVARNRAIIVFPRTARILWWLYRLSPNLVLLIGRKVVLDYIKRRNARGSAAIPLEDKKTVDAG